MDKVYFEIDGIPRVFLVERKKTATVKLKVYPDLSIKLIVPEKITIDEINDIIERRKKWLRQSIEFYSKNQRAKQTGLRSGSAIYYLGKQYMLKVIETDTNNVKLSGKYLLVSVKVKDPNLIANLVEEWYRHHARQYFRSVISRLTKKLAKYGIQEPDLLIRKMKSRWGSCIQTRNKITLNLELIKESSRSIEYVIMHELCHLKYPSHNKQFYTFLSIVMPDWQLRKKRLERLML